MIKRLLLVLCWVAAGVFVPYFLGKRLPMLKAYGEPLQPPWLNGFMWLVLIGFLTGGVTMLFIGIYKYIKHGTPFT